MASSARTNHRISSICLHLGFVFHQAPLQERMSRYKATGKARNNPKQERRKRKNSGLSISGDSDTKSHGRKRRGGTKPLLPRIETERRAPNPKRKRPKERSAPKAQKEQEKSETRAKDPMSRDKRACQRPTPRASPRMSRANATPFAQQQQKPRP